MIQQPEFARSCDRCGREIRFGNAALLIYQTTERFDGIQANIEESHDLLVVCARCGNSPRLAEESLRAELLGGRTLPTGDLPARNAADDVCFECEFCDAPVRMDAPYVIITRSIAQLDWDDALQMGEIIVIDCSGLVSLCLSCGSGVDPAWFDCYTRPPL